MTQMDLKCPGIKEKRKNRVFFIPSHPSLVAPVSEVAEEKYFCPLLIWGWLRKGGMSEGGKKGRRRGRSGGTGELREVY